MSSSTSNQAAPPDLSHLPTFMFFDYDEKFVKEYQTLMTPHLPPKTQFVTSDVRALMDQVDVFLSPANSFGAMDGGIDEIYMEMFVGIEKNVQKKIYHVSQHFSNRFANKKLLPVGSAFITEAISAKDDKVKKQLIVAPTMQLPHRLNKRKNEDRNVYYAMIAIFKIAEQLGPDVVIGIPGMGTGVGGLNGQESAAMILQAFLDYFILKKMRYPYPDNVTILDQTGDPKMLRCYQVSNFLY